MWIDYHKGARLKKYIGRVPRHQTISLKIIEWPLYIDRFIQPTEYNRQKITVEFDQLLPMATNIKLKLRAKNTESPTDRVQLITSPLAHIIFSKPADRFANLYLAFFYQ